MVKATWCEPEFLDRLVQLVQDVWREGEWQVIGVMPSTPIHWHKKLILSGSL